MPLLGSFIFGTREASLDLAAPILMPPIGPSGFSNGSEDEEDDEDDDDDKEED